MDYKDVIREKQNKLEDDFIDRAEKAINDGKSFDEEFVGGWDVNYRLSPEWRTRYEEMQKQAAPYAQYHKKWSADGIRKQISDLRQAKQEQETDERFYQDNKTKWYAVVEAGESFEDLGEHESLRKYYDRACKEILGYIPEPKKEPALDPFLVGMMDDRGIL